MHFVKKNLATVIVAFLALAILLPSRVAAQGQPYAVVHTFSGAPDDGANPAANMVRDAANNLYGTTQNGGVFGAGTVFKIDSLGNYSVLHNFIGPEGVGPSDLIVDGKGNLYGTATGGGRGYGTVFKIDPSGSLSVLHDFEGGLADGATPVAGLVLDANGYLYGTTTIDPCNVTFFSICTPAGGVIFKIDTAGNNYSILYNIGYYDALGFGFSNHVPPGYPAAGLTLDAAGNLYGTTRYGVATTATTTTTTPAPCSS